MAMLIRRLLALALVVALPTLANAQALTPLNGPVFTTAPTGSSLQPFEFFCTASQALCWPQVQLWDGTTRATINSSDGGLNSHITNPLLSPGTATESNSNPVTTPLTTRSTDPCYLGGGVGNPVTKFAFNFSATTSPATTAAAFAIVPAASVTNVYICSIDINVPAADVVSLVGGLGSTCATGTPIAIAGSTTAASGMSFPANFTWSRGDGGSTVYRSTTSGHGICVFHTGSGAILVSGTAVQQ